MSFSNMANRALKSVKESSNMDRRVNDSVLMYMQELGANVVADSGIPSDRFHLGKLIIYSLKQHPEFRSQIDGGTGDVETNASVLERSIEMAVALKQYGIHHKDVVAIMAPSHVDVCIAFYAALYIGAIVQAIDMTLGVKELQAAFEIGKPRVIFCQSDKASDIQLALNEADLTSEIISFDKGDYMIMNFGDFLTQYSDHMEYSHYGFRATDFDAEEAIAFIIPTSGTTGLPKAAAISHKNMAIAGPYLWSKYRKFPEPTYLAMIGSPLQWLSAIINFTMSPILGYPRLQTSLKLDQEHCYELINKYRPTWVIMSPTMLATLLKYPDYFRCDFTCFEDILLGGSAVSVDLIRKLKTLTLANTADTYGMSELSGLGFMVDETTPLGSCGKPLPCLQYRLVDVDNNENIIEAHKEGELYVKGPGVFVGYYGNTEATQDSFALDGWLKTGDLFYRDPYYNYFYVDRIKMLMKYKSNQISPIELENVIRSHPGVHDVTVTSVSDAEDGELPVACVVRKHGDYVTAEDIKDIVRENLASYKHLHGGVIFLDEMPMTASTKVHRQKLKQMVKHMQPE